MATTHARCCVVRVPATHVWVEVCCRCLPRLRAMRCVKRSDRDTHFINAGPSTPHCCSAMLRAYLIWRPLRTARMTFRRCRPSWNVCRAASRAVVVTHGRPHAQVADAASWLRGRMGACKTRAEPTLATDGFASSMDVCVPVDCHKALRNRWTHQERPNASGCFALTSLLHNAQLRCTNICCPSATPSLSGPTRSPSVPCR